MPGRPAKTNTTRVDFYQIGNSTYMKNESEAVGLALDFSPLESHFENY